MKIGIDATSLPEHPVGAGRYILHLIESLAHIITNDELIVFIHHNRRHLLKLTEGDHIRLVVIKDKNVAWRLIWEQTHLPGLTKKLKLDILHSPHYTMPFVHPCASIVTFHDMGFFLYPALYTTPKRVLFPLVMRQSARRSDALIAVSDSTRVDAIRLLKLPPQKITTIHLGVTPNFRLISDGTILENVRQKYKLPEKFLLYVGTVEPRKNLVELLNAYKLLLARLPHQHLVIAGQLGWMYQDILAKLKDEVLRDKVYLAGYIPQEDLPAIYNLADIVIYPSLYEGFGLPVLEAMACGTPVITTNKSSIPEIVGDAGILLPEPDEETIFEAMLNLLNDPEKRREFSEKGLLRAAGFTWEATARATLEVYRRVMAR